MSNIILCFHNYFFLHPDLPSLTTVKLTPRHTAEVTFTQLGNLAGNIIFILISDLPISKNILCVHNYFYSNIYTVQITTGVNTMYIVQCKDLFTCESLIVLIVDLPLYTFITVLFTSRFTAHVLQQNC